MPILSDHVIRMSGDCAIGEGIVIRIISDHMKLIVRTD